MIKNNRPMAINISYKGKQIGFASGECKKLAHFFSPMDEYILAKRFGLEYIPDKDIQSKLETKNPTNRNETIAREQELKTISDEMDDSKKEQQEMLDKQVQNLKEEAIKSMERAEKKKIQTEIAVDFEQKEFKEEDVVPVKEKLKQKAEIVETAVEELQELQSEDILLKKPKTPAKKTTKKTPAKKTTKKTPAKKTTKKATTKKTEDK